MNSFILMEAEKQFHYLRQRKLLERLDLFPFLIIHSLLAVLYLNEEIHYFFKMIVIVLLILIQLIVFFCKFWSEKLRAHICFKKCKTVEEASHIRIDLLHKHFKINDRTEISKIIRTGGFVIIEFDKLNYIYNESKQTFIKASYDLHKKLADFNQIKPYSTVDEVKINQLKLGSNVMKIPIPSFFELYREHIVAPFFVFQLFCIMLWVFDDYGLHSGMTLCMLCIFEATVVGQRIMNLVTLRKMRNPPHLVYVYRYEKWEKISSADLIPGDFVSIVPGTNLEQCPEQNTGEETNAFFVNFLKKLKEMKKKAEEKRGLKPVSSVVSSNKERDPSPLTCDLLLLSGSVISNEAMLTGESIPQIKDSIGKMEEKLELIYDPKSAHKPCTLYAGTTIIKASREEEDTLPEQIKSNPPDNGCLCLVVKTGFNTSQGKLLRTVMFTSDKNQGESKEAFIFIFILLAIAIYASYTVFQEGIQREGEITYKLILRCIIIVTSVVPAELPIELSLAINNSLMYLQSKKIVCIEPFRIPYAGKIDTCCFDKTGTLTKDEFIMRGIVLPNGLSTISGQETNEQTASILLGCNSLISIGGKVVGDPIELVVFKSAGGTIEKGIINSKRGTKVIVERRYAFDSALKRMSVLCTVVSSIFQNTRTKRVLTKGAPEVMKSIFASIPEDYDETANNFAKKGFRILAIGYRDDDTLNYHSHREDIEKNHVFCGFIIVETPLKNDTTKYINELTQADLDCIIITGDHYLTTAKVALDLNIGPTNILFAKVNSSSDKHIEFEFRNLDNKLDSTLTLPSQITELSKNNMLGITGDELEKLEALDEKLYPGKCEIFKAFKLYCRVAPLQKDSIVSQLIKAGCNPSMCGDGSNDVGALKRAMVGVALLNSEEAPQAPGQKEQPFSILSLDDDTGLKSGDVTAAAPFTSKSGSIKCMKNIFIRGRCTLVITFQMFKILALNCLLTAYSMSVLALKGIKFSDFQSTFIGFLIAFCFLMLSKGEPLKKLNKNKPQFTFFTYHSVLSITSQAVSHLVSLQLIISITESYDPVAINTVKSLDDPYAPSLVNSVVFLYTAINNVTNFLVNYIGEPFMENLSKNVWMQRLCLGVWIGVSICIFDVLPDLNEYFELVPLPQEFEYKISFMAILFSDLILCYIVENWKKIFKLYK